MSTREESGRSLPPTTAQWDVAKIEEAQRALSLQAERHRAVAQAAASILWSADAEGHIHDVAQQWHTFTGQTETQYRDDGWLNAVHPEDRTLAARTWTRAREHEVPADAVYRLRHASGSYRFVSVRYVPVFDDRGRLREWVGWMADIDARVRAERERDRYFTVALDLLCVAEHDGRFKRVNPAFETTLGFTADELCSAPYLDFVHPEDRVATLVEIERLTQGVAVTRFENRYRCRDGSYRWLAWSAFPDAESGLIFAAARDITERREAEARLKEQAARLAEADRRKDEFLAMLAHELRNPLNPIRSAVDVLRLTNGPDKLAWGLGVIDRQLSHLTHLVDDLLDVARVTRGRIKLNKSPIDLREVVEDAVETVRPMMQQRRHELRVSLPAVALTIEADRLRIGQVLVNLLDNAAKYTDEAGRIEVSAEIEGPRILVRVRDNGIGIEPHMAPKLFEVFGQADRSIERAQGGLGLGLTLVRRLTEMHGGSVTVQSEGTGRGSIFTVNLPLIQRDSSAVDYQRPEPTRAGAPLRVLVVDDNAAVAEGLGMLLDLIGYEVQTAPDGPTALVAARTFKPEVGLLDIGLPGMDGCELAKLLRELYDHTPLLLIALTGYGDDLTRERVKQACFDHHMLKPCDSDVLENLLADYAEGKRRTVE